LTIAVCAIFLAPTVRWYFFVPAQDKIIALGSREQIKNYASRKAVTDLDRVIESARTGADLPNGLDFLLKEAKKINKLAKSPAPKKWDSRAVLSMFADRSEVQGVLEEHYRDTIFELKNLQKNAVQLGLDLSGGLSIVLQANLPAYEEKLGHPLSEDERNGAIAQALEVLNNRIDRFGLTEPVIRRQGVDQIYVEIPGTADPERINDIIMGKGSLTFQMVDDDALEAFNRYYQANPGSTFDGQGNLLDPAIIPADCEVRGVYTKDRYGLDEFTGYTVIKKEIGLDGNHITDARVERDSLDGRPEVNFQLDNEGAIIFEKLTSANRGKRLATVLDDRVRSQATIQSTIRESGRLTGFNAEESENLAMILRSAALPVELEVANQQTIGASMGEDTIYRGLYALLGGLAAVMAFMLAFYKVAGFNAVVAQIFNIFIMFSILSAFSYTLTLPSIAGFILTIGMAVDANVIIFERIKEELLLHKTRKAAVEAGFSKAFWAIMDANITTFIAAVFLSQLGSGPIQGFAVSLAIGVFSSVFTALFVSRLIFDFGTDVLGNKKVSISWRIK
jgi:preprotein translocase subunit SecD